MRQDEGVSSAARCIACVPQNVDRTAYYRRAIWRCSSRAAWIMLSAYSPCRESAHRHGKARYASARWCVSTFARAAYLLAPGSLKGGTMASPFQSGRLFIAFADPTVADPNAYVTIDVDGLDTAGGRWNLRLCLLTAPGVKQVDLMTQGNRMRIAFDAARTSPEAIRDALVHAHGRPAHIVMIARPAGLAETPSSGTAQSTLSVSPAMAQSPLRHT